MSQSAKTQAKLRQWCIITAYGIFGGLVFVLFSDGFKSIFYFINGAVIGFIIAAIGGFVELFVFDEYLRRKKFLVLFFSRTLFFLFLVISVAYTEMVVARMIRDGSSFEKAMKSPDFLELHKSGEFAIAVIYILAMISIVNFTRQMNRKLGSGVLVNFITGKYYQPVYTQRIFMFMRILHSDEIIEKIGRVKFHRFINEIMYDISEPVIRNKGSIYEYVEDEVVISWHMDNGIENGHCIRAFFEARQDINEKKETYFQSYGFVPMIKAALHVGKVVRGEIGDIKSQIVFHGDVMNTAARILEACSLSSRDILVTTRLLEYLNIPFIYKTEPCGTINVRGREKPVVVHALLETDLSGLNPVQNKSKNHNISTN